MGKEDPIEGAIRPIHPGEILRDELTELGLSARSFAKALDIPVNRVTQILCEQRGVSADTALRLARYSARRPSSGWTCRAISSCAERGGMLVLQSSRRFAPGRRRAPAKFPGERAFRPDR